MFSSIAIRRSTAGPREPGVDLGSLAESILFYGRVDLLINRGSLRQLLAECGAEVTLRLVEEGYVVPRYCHWNAGILTENTGTPQAVHRPTFISVNTNFEQDMRDLWDEACGRSGRTRRMRERFIRACPQVPTPSGLVNQGAAKLFGDPAFLENAARNVLHTFAPDYRLPTGFFFRAVDAPDNFVSIETNADFGASGNQDLNAGHVLVEVAEAMIDMDLGSTLGSDVLASDLSASLIQLRTNSALAQVAARNDLATFSDLFLDGGDIRSAINSGRRRLEDIFPLLDRSRMFRDWLARETVDSTLVKAYLEECVKDSWAQHLPTRILRWVLVTIASMHVPAVAAAGIAGFDSLMLDRISKGWKPNQFVDRQLKPFALGH